MKAKLPEKVLLLDNIRSTFNVGSIFRTADCLGIDKIYLCGITPTPIDRFGRERRDIAKVSLGAEKSIGWEAISDTLILVKNLKKQGYKIIAIEQSTDSADYRKIKIKKNEKVALLVGNEVEGISQSILKYADVIAEIPLCGKKESLNVLVAFAVAAFQMFHAR
jgi:tRNA G18 (ribose-2'-O)-methylase SpoU